MEREKRVIKITCAGSLVSPNRHPFSCSLQSNPQNSFTITSITFENSCHIFVAHWAKSTLCAIIITDKWSWSLLPFCGHCYEQSTDLLSSLYFFPPSLLQRRVMNIIIHNKRKKNVNSYPPFGFGKVLLKLCTHTVLQVLLRCTVSCDPRKRCEK